MLRHLDVVTVQTLPCESEICRSNFDLLIHCVRYNKTLSSSAVSVSGSDNTTFFGQSVTGSLLKENCGAKLSNGSFWAYPNQTGQLPPTRRGPELNMPS